MKIMVVDDEPLINQYIVQCIRAADPGSEIIGAVTSGAKALKKLEETSADLVFADITMPKMDGIELLKEIKKRDPSIAVVMLTCHDDFEYARSAMQNRASDYVLKNEVSVERIRAVLQAVENARKERIAKGVVQQISRNNFLHRLVEQDETVQPVRESILRTNHIYLADSAFLIAVFQNSEHNVHLMQEWTTNGFENPLFYAYSDREMFLLINIRRSMDKWQDGDAVMFFRDREKELEGLAGFSTVHHHLENLPRAFAEATADQDARFYQVPAANVFEERAIERVEAYIMHATVRFEEREVGAGCAEIEKLMEFVGEQHVRVTFLKEALLQLFTGIQAKLSIELEGIEDGIEQSRTFAALNAWVKQALDSLRHKGKVYSAPIQRALDYIGLHYTEDISLNMVADFVYLNRDYLSRQFKKEVGMNFSEYLMNLRMKRAKRLLETTNMRISDIALSVGITNMSYFSTVFHKTFGCKPNDIRKMQKER